MKHFEERALSTLTFDKPKIWYRFVDDVFAIVKKLYVNALLQHLNAQHPSIQFTVEIEQNGSLSFMDVRVHRTKNRRLTLDIYRKPTHSGRYLQHSSHQPESVKRSVARALFDRVQYVTGSI